MEAGITKEILRDAVAKANLKFRPGHGELLRWVDQEGVPLLMFSAGIAGTHDTKRVKYRNMRWWQGARFVGLLLHALRRFVAVAGKYNLPFFPLLGDVCSPSYGLRLSLARESFGPSSARMVVRLLSRTATEDLFLSSAANVLGATEDHAVIVESQRVLKFRWAWRALHGERGGQDRGLQRQTQVYSPTAHFYWRQIVVVTLNFCPNQRDRIFLWGWQMSWRRRSGSTRRSPCLPRAK